MITIVIAKLTQLYNSNIKQYTMWGIYPKYLFVALGLQVDHDDEEGQQID